MIAGLLFVINAVLVNKNFPRTVINDGRFFSAHTRRHNSALRERLWSDRRPLVVVVVVLTVIDDERLGHGARSVQPRPGGYETDRG